MTIRTWPAHGGTIRDVAERAGVSPATVSRRFSTGAVELTDELVVRASSGPAPEVMR